MSWPEHVDPEQDGREAHAPYNFVPLPEAVVVSDAPPDQDRYYTREEDIYRYTGYLECALTTLTPLYTRCMMRVDFYRDFGGLPFYDLDEPQKQERAKFFHIHDLETPVIPGSSLRGMVRSLVEIAGYSKISWVGASKIFFRAVAGGDLAAPYQALLGKLGSYVKAGYLERNNGRWQIQPALRPRDIGLKDKEYVKIKETFLQTQAIPGFLDFNHRDYKPQYHKVSFEVAKGWVSRMGEAGAGYPHQGVLVCAGNMLETDSSDTESPRRKHALVLAKNGKAKPLEINEQAVEDYLDALTDFQKSEPFDERTGCLIEGNPIFYVEEQGEVFLFGHSPNFRTPMRRDQTKRAATPLDFVPEALRREAEVDLAEAIFGYVKDKSAGKGKARACAGRLFFSDAQYQPDGKDVWLPDAAKGKSGIITPRVLSSPKPTTFQHYLTQDKPNDARTLRHYGSIPGEETVIRGHKLYWHRETTLADIKADPDEVEAHPKQYTRIQPVRAGANFRFKVHFENLSEVELGALLWVLALPPGHYHKLGMGKPLGMGSVAIKPRLFLNNRRERYANLFNEENNGWNSGFSGQEEPAQRVVDFKKKFEDFVLKGLKDSGVSTANQLEEQDRIKALLHLLRGVPSPSRTLTDYLELASFDKRPVLPTPEHLLKKAEAEDKLSDWISVDQVEARLAVVPKELEYPVGHQLKMIIPEAERIDGGKVYIRLDNGDAGFLIMSPRKLKQVKNREMTLEVVEITSKGYYLRILS